MQFVYISKYFNGKIRIMSIKNNKVLILKEIKKEFNLKSDAEFARFLDIKPQTLSSWYSRNTFDIELLYSKCVGIDGNFLLTGERPVLKKVQDPNSKNDSLGNDQQDMVDKLTKFNEMLEKQNILQSNAISDKDKIISMQENEIERLTKENILLNEELGRRSQTKSAG